MARKQNLTLANKIRNLKSGERFEVVGKREREEACKIIKALRDAGILMLEVITRETAPKSGKFNVIAL